MRNLYKTYRYVYFIQPLGISRDRPYGRLPRKNRLKKPTEETDYCFVKGSVRRAFLQVETRLHYFHETLSYF